MHVHPVRPSTSFPGWRLLPILMLLLAVVPWIVTLLHIRDLPLFADSIQTIGAGARLSVRGHFGSTFMLYGLVNPYILEIFLRLGFGPLSCLLMRYVQFLYLVMGYLGVTACLRALHPRIESGISPYIPAALGILGSVVFLVEGFELTPELPTFVVLTWSLCFCLRFDGTYKRLLPLVITTVLLVGIRPTGFTMAFPVLCIIVNHAPPDSGMRRIWLPGMFILVMLVLAAVLLSGLNYILLSALGLLPSLVLTCYSVAVDVRKRNVRCWLQVAFLVASTGILAGLLFPNYLLHLMELKRQLYCYFILEMEMTVPSHALSNFLDNLMLGTLSLTIHYAGPLGSTGFFAGLGFLVRDRKTIPLSNLMLFIAGLIPCAMLTCTLTDVERYLFPLMSIVWVIAAYGLFRLLNYNGFRWILIAPLLLSLIETSEVPRYRMVGGALNALSRIRDFPGAEVSFPSFSGDPDRYASGDPYIWPIFPYVEDMEQIRLRPFMETDVLLTFTDPEEHHEGFAPDRLWCGRDTPCHWVKHICSPRAWGQFWTNQSKPWRWRFEQPIGVFIRTAGNVS